MSLNRVITDINVSTYVMKLRVWGLLGWGWEGKSEEEKEVPSKDMSTLKNAIEYLFHIVTSKNIMALSRVRLLPRNYIHGHSVYLSKQIN